MASYYERKGSKYYYIRYQMADGSWRAKSSGIVVGSAGSKRKIIAMMQEYTLKEACVHDDGGGAFFRQWVMKFIDYRYLNPNTNWRYKNGWTHLETFLDMKKVLHPGEVTYQLIHEYVRWRTDAAIAKRENRKAASWNTALVETRVLGAILQEAVKRGFILVSPCARLGLPRRNAKEKREITMDEQNEMTAILAQRGEDDWMLPCFLVAIKQGCRLSETRVPMSQVNVADGIIIFNVKGGKQHVAPLHADLLPLAEKRILEKAKFLVDTPSSAARQWHRWFRAEGFENVSFHCTRVTVVTRLARAGFSEVQTMQYVGHASDVVHAVYRKLRPPDLVHLGEAL